jgi:hypothetical protein
MGSDSVCVSCGDLEGISESEWDSYSSSDFAKNFEEPVLRWLVDGISSIADETPWMAVFNQVVVDLANETIKLEFGPMLVAAGHFQSLREIDPRYRTCVQSYVMRRADLAELPRPLSQADPTHVERACLFRQAHASWRSVDQDKFKFHRALYDLVYPS